MNRTKLIVTIVLLILGVLFVVSTCYRSGKGKARTLPPGTHGVTVAEVIQTSAYTYLQVEENGQKFWIAVEKRDSKPGDSLYYSQAAEMTNFVSKELGRTFPSVYFVQDPSDKLAPPPQAANQPVMPRKVEVKRWSEVSVEVPKGGITLADLYKNPGSYAGKSVIIRGTVVRYNSQIMNKNWIHIQDGTESFGKFDLTITTTDSVKVGSSATFKGIIAIDKDFGSGYKYDVIMEQAVVSDKK